MRRLKSSGAVFAPVHAHSPPQACPCHFGAPRASPSSSQAVLSIPMAPFATPSRTKLRMFVVATPKSGRMRDQLLTPGQTKNS